MSFIAWAPEGSRAGSISRALGGEWRTFHDRRIHHKALVPVRYFSNAARTLWYLIRRRPRAVIVQSPPVPAAALVVAWAKAARVPVVMDTHPASFALAGDLAIHGLMRPLLSALVPRADACLVTTPELGEGVSRWDGTPLIVHEAPMVWSDGMRPRRDCSGHRRLLFVCTFAPDEPFMEVLEAARAIPEVTFQITGDLRRRPARAKRIAPPNVEWVGYLGPDEYLAALVGADVVMALTRRPESVQRSAHEAVDALRPLVLTNWPHMGDLFPHAVLVDNDPASIRHGITEAFDRCSELNSLASEARAVQHARWERQLTDLKAALKLE
jgi:glycosyltransferase involved in cell wall biosynthesis